MGGDAGPSPYITALQREYRTLEVNHSEAMLGVADIAWLTQLAGHEVDEEWLERANSFIAVGSVNLQHDTEPLIRSQVIAARKGFYEGCLGWGDKAHPLNKAYTTHASKSEVIVPVNTMVQTQRVLIQLGLDNARLVRKNPNLLHLSAESVAASINGLTALGLDAQRVIYKGPKILSHNNDTIAKKKQDLEQMGLDATHIINNYPQVIHLKSSKIARRKEQIEYVAGLLGWEGGTTKELIETFPGILVFSNEKLMAHARIFAEHGDPGFNVGQVKNLVINALEAHIISLVQDDRYYAGGVQTLVKNLPGGAAGRKRVVAELLEDQAGLEEIIGRKVVRSYLQYAGKEYIEQAEELMAA